MTARGKWRVLWISLCAVLGVVVVVVGGAAIWLSRFDPNSEKPRIIALVKQATGRTLALNGKISLHLSLEPTLQIEDAALSNPPGFSRPEMATLQRMDLRLSLLPLLSRHIEIDTLLLVHPDILLETNAQGRANWVFRPPAQPSAATPQPSQPAQPSAAAQPGAPAAPPFQPSRGDVFSVRHVSIQDGTIAYRNDATGKVTTLAVSQLTTTSKSMGAPLHLVAAATYDDTAFNLTADTGPLNRLQEPDSTTPWPLRLTLQTGTVTFGVDGTMTRPLRGRGYNLAVNGSVPDLAALAPLVPGTPLPPLRGLTFAAHLADRAQALPEITAVTLHIGASDLGSISPGWTLDRLDVTDPATDQPAKVSIAAKSGDTPVTLDGTVGPPALLLTPSQTPQAFPIDLVAQAAGSSISAKGQIAQPRALTGVNITLAGQSADLATLSALLHRPVPALKQVTVAADLTDADGGIAKGLALRSARFTSAAGDLSGDAALRFGAVPALTATLTSDRLDADAVRQAFAAEPVVPPPAGAPAQAAPPPSAPKAAPPSAPKAAPPSAREAPPGQQPIQWGDLRKADADVTLAIGTLRAGGTDYRQVKAHIGLRAGVLSLDPVTATLPTGALQMAAVAKPPSVSLTLHEPGLPLAPLLASLGEPATVSGNLEAYVDLHGSGDTPHAIAASLTGSLGIAMSGGTIDNRLLGATLSQVLKAVNALDLVGRGGTSDVRCLGTRIDFRDGIGTVRNLALSSSLLTMSGDGSIDLRSDTLNLLVKPQMRIVGTSLVVPMRVTGPIASPSTRVDARGAAEDNAGTVAGAVLGDATPLGLLGGVLGADKLLSGSGDVCPAALALARGQAPPAKAAQSSKPKTQGVEGLLRNLFH